MSTVEHLMAHPHTRAHARACAVKKKERTRAHVELQPRSQFKALAVSCVTVKEIAPDLSIRGYLVETYDTLE